MKEYKKKFAKTYCMVENVTLNIIRDPRKAAIAACSILRISWRHWDITWVYKIHSRSKKKTWYNKISKIFVFSLLQNYSAASLILHFFGFLALLVQNTRLLTISEPKGCVNYLEHIIHYEYVFEKSILCYGTVVHKISKALDFSFL